MNALIKLPFYAKAAFLLIGFYLFVYMLYIGKDLILPLMYAAMFAVLLSPIVGFFVRKKMSRIVVVSVVLTLATAATVLLILFISSRISTLDTGLPELKAKFESLLDDVVHWISQQFRIRERDVDLWMNDSKDEIMDSGSEVLGITLSDMGGALSTMFLTPVYVFLILFYEPHLTQFTYQLFARTSIERVNELVSNVLGIIKSYLSGLFIQFLLVSAMNIGGLLLLGIEYVVVLGIIGGLLNLIPYMGGVLTMLLFMAIALVTKPPIFVLYVVLLYGVIQFIDNNIIVPKVLGSKVQLNALVSVVAVVAGGMLWGIPGMFLSIPMVAIIKLIFDLFDPLKPWGFLMGETEGSNIEIIEESKS